MNTSERLSYLYHRYVEATASEPEVQELFSLADDPQHEEHFRKLLNHSWADLEETDKILQQCKPAKVVKLYQRGWFKVAAAAVILFIVAGTYLALFNSNNVQPPSNGIVVVKQNDVPAPASNRAMVKLANGQTIYLDSTGNGELAVQGNVKLVKLANEQIAYENANGTVTTELQYNTLFNPKGSKVINITLADGSKVWLNAGSSVTYPVAFIGNDRKVNITGEVYFEVAHDASRPFHVASKDQDITVLGTHFNVNAYDDEDAIRTTLLEGSVKIQSVTNSQTSAMLKPGQQAKLVSNLKFQISNPDLDAVMAWKNGLFNFSDADITQVMRQAARWYDVDVVYIGKRSSETFSGRISRNTNLSELLKILEINGVKWKIEGKTVTIMN